MPTRRPASLACVWIVGVLSACGAPAAETALVAPTIIDRSVAGAARVDDRGRGMEVQGLHGSLSPRVAQEAIHPYLSEVTGCFALRSMSFEELGGSLRMQIRVSASGVVVSAQPEDSTVGDREVERCVSRVLSAARFPRPQGGGEALVHWGMSIDPPSSVREPATWDPARVASVVRRRAAHARTACAVSAPVQVTAYVSRSGRVLSAGAASAEETPADRLDCVAAQVRRWRMPNASRIAKVTFDLG
ncbi:MAG: AgmX/PglI C-terminal domain-containing protein [Sandaracinaceae bacterium]